MVMFVAAKPTSISFSGLESGLDTAAIVKSMVAVAHRPIDNVQAHQAQLNAHQAIYTKILGQLQALHTALQNMDAAAFFKHLGATSSDAGVVTGTVSRGASTGSYKIEVQQLASAQRSYSNAVRAADQPNLLGSGTLTLQMGTSSPASFIIDGNSTLQGLSDAINSSGGDVGAVILTDVTGARLVVSGKKTGADQTISFTESGTTLGLGDAVNQAQHAQDAQILLDNTSTITSATNTVMGAIPGVTLHLAGKSATPQTVMIGVDPTAIKTDVQGFVDAYNALMTTISSAINYNGQVDPNRLVGDSSLQSLVVDVQNVITHSVPGGAGAVQSLAQLGLSTHTDGTLVFDSAAFQAAISQDPQAVAALFANPAGVSRSMESVITKYTAASGGVLTTQSQSIVRQVHQMDSQVLRMQGQLDLYERNLNAQFYQLETTMAQLKAQGSYLDQLKSLTFGKS